MEVQGKEDNVVEDDVDTFGWEEVEVADGEVPMDEDDESEIGEGDEDNVEEMFQDMGEGLEEEAASAMAEDVVDISNFTFPGHGDAVYCAAIHPTRPGIVLTGGGDDKVLHFLRTMHMIHMIQP